MDQLPIALQGSPLANVTPALRTKPPLASQGGELFTTTQALNLGRPVTRCVCIPGSTAATTLAGNRTVGCVLAGPRLTATPAGAPLLVAHVGQSAPCMPDTPPSQMHAGFGSGFGKRASKALQSFATIAALISSAESS